MASVGIRELKDGLSAILERVENGETVEVTKRGRTVARITPTGLPPGLQKMTDEGRLTWSGNTHAPDELPPPTPLIGDGPDSTWYVQDGRR